MTIKSITDKLGDLVTHKNSVYGDSAGKSAQFLKLLYPSGVPVESYADVLLLVRIFDKQMRIATSPNALAENPYSDIAGYAIMALVEKAQLERAIFVDAEDKQVKADCTEADYTKTATNPVVNKTASSFITAAEAARGLR